MLSSYLSSLSVGKWMSLLVAGSSAAYLCSHWLQNKQNIPGPLRLPIVGSLPFIMGDLREVMTEMNKKYGDIFIIYVGSESIVVLNGLDTIKEALIQNEKLFDGRSQKQFQELTFNLGKGIFLYCYQDVILIIIMIINIKFSNNNY